VHLDCASVIELEVYMSVTLWFYAMVLFDAFGCVRDP
jgi:hypothetical protein